MLSTSGSTASFALRLDQAAREDRLDLRSEEQRVAGARPVERLDAEPIAHQQQPPLRRVPDREREHAAEAMRRSPRPTARRRGRSFRCPTSSGSGGRALRARVRTSRVVVDLAVEDDPHAAVFVRQRLLSRAQVDDAEAAMGERRVGVAVQPGFVRTAMRDDVAHPHGARRRVLVESVDGDDSGDAAHDQAASPPRRRACRSAATLLGRPRTAGTTTRASPGSRADDDGPAAVAVLAPEPAHGRGRRRCRGRAGGRRAAARRPSAPADRAATRRSALRIRASGRSTIAFGMRRSSSRRSRYLLRPFFSFSDVGTVGGELEQLVIEQRLARFERHGHAHLVDLGHDVVDQIGLHVDVQRAVERIARRARIRTPGGSRRTDRRRAPARRSRASRARRARPTRTARTRACAHTRRPATAPDGGATARLSRRAADGRPAVRRACRRSGRATARASASHCSTRWRA